MAWASSRVADRAGSALGASVGRVAALLPRPAAELRPEPFAAPGSLVVVDDVQAAPERAGPRARARRRGHFRITHGVHVPARVVLRLADAGVRPHGAYVRSDGVRPGGVRLAGVSSLGIGVRDGDVLTRVAGAPARSAGDVISAVVAARGRMAPAVSGVFWRGHVPYRLVVEQPYVPARRVAAR
jgi:S1-C subfamily serine protease